MTVTASSTSVHSIVDEVRTLARHDCASAWTRLSTWAASSSLNAADPRRAYAAPSGSGTVTVEDGRTTVTGSWLGAPADPATEVFVVTAELDGEAVAVAVGADAVTTRTYTDAGLESVPLVRIVCVDVVVAAGDVLGTPAPVLVAIAAIVAGLAQELTEQVTTLARTKVRSGTADVLLSDPVVLDALQHARVELDALVALLLDRAARHTDDAMLHVVARVLIDRAEELTARILTPVGSAVLYLSSPLQQVMRDLATVARHAGGVPSDLARAALDPRP